MPTIKLYVDIKKEIELDFKDQYDLEQIMKEIGYNGIKDPCCYSSVAYLAKCDSDEIEDVHITYITGNHELSLSDGLDIWDRKKTLKDVLNKKQKDNETLPLFSEGG